MAETQAAVPPDTGRLLFEIKKVIVGQDHLIERLMVGLLARGHLLVGCLEDVEVIVRSEDGVALDPLHLRAVPANPVRDRDLELLEVGRCLHGLGGQSGEHHILRHTLLLSRSDASRDHEQ